MLCPHCKKEFSYTVLSHHLDRCEENKNRGKAARDAAKQADKAKKDDGTKKDDKKK